MATLVEQIAEEVSTLPLQLQKEALDKEFLNEENIKEARQILQN